MAKYILAYLLLLILGWFVLRVLVRRDYWLHGKLSTPVSMLHSLLFFIYGGFPYLYLSRDWPIVRVNSTVHLIGLSLITVGLASLCYGMVKLGILASIGLKKEQLEQGGIYRLTRNPQALACGLYVLGFAMLWPSWYAVFWAVLYVILIHTMILTEEEHLLNKFGERYQAYCEHVPRYFCILR